MKTLMTTAALAMTLIASSAFAQTIETTREINAQTTITRGNIDNVLSRINNHRPDSPFRASDYHAQAQDFKNTVDQKFKTFEDQMKNQVFAKVAFWLEQYNSIYHSADYSKEQKEVLLKTRYENLKGQIGLVSSEYQALIKSVYNTIPINEVKIKNVLTPSVIEIDNTIKHSQKVEVKIVVNDTHVIGSRDFYVVQTPTTKKAWGFICFTLGQGKCDVEFLP